jgi:hypothetical protein
VSRFIDENALAIAALAVIACWSLAVHVDPVSSPIVSNIASGLLGYLAKGVRTAA